MGQQTSISSIPYIYTLIHSNTGDFIVPHFGDKVVSFIVIFDSLDIFAYLLIWLYYLYLY
jgi:hypothetical protein